MFHVITKYISLREDAREAAGSDGRTVSADRDFRRTARARPGVRPSGLDEQGGDAQAAAFEDVALLNARTEILKLAKPEIRARLTAQEDPDGCTGVVVQPQASQAGRLIHAQNWDWKRECAETAVVLKVRRDDGPDLLTFTEAGALGRCGFNAVGIAITANYLESDRDYRQVGVPLALIRRKVLECEHLAIAMRTVYCT